VGESATHDRWAVRRGVLAAVGEGFENVRFEDDEEG
jgi:hypothetical protein